jgi:hypothetical protein
MAKSENGRIVETPTEARQAEPGPSVLLVLAISIIVAIGVLTCVWIVFFRTWRITCARERHPDGSKPLSSGASGGTAIEPPRRELRAP